MTANHLPAKELLFFLMFAPEVAQKIPESKQAVLDAGTLPFLVHILKAELRDMYCNLSTPDSDIVIVRELSDLLQAVRRQRLEPLLSIEVVGSSQVLQLTSLALLCCCKHDDLPYRPASLFRA
jgi:hypothetical protein